MEGSSAGSKQKADRRRTVQFLEGSDNKRSQIPGELWLKTGSASDSLGRRSLVAHAGVQSRGERMLQLARVHLMEAMENEAVTPALLEKLKDVQRLIRQVEVHDDENAGRPFSPGSPIVEESSRRSSKGYYRRLSASSLLSRSPNLDTEVARYIKGTCTTDQARRPSAMSIDLDRRRPSQTSETGSTYSDSITQLDSQTMALMEKVGSFEVDCGAIAAQVESGVLALLFGTVMSRTGLIQDLVPLILKPDASGGAFEERMSSFIIAAEQAYLQNPYHNSTHAADVLMMMHWFWSTKWLQRNLSPLDQLMCYISAAIHDMGHDGVNNMFHQKTRSILSLRYNDRSPLENMHVALAFETMKAQQECNWFELISRAFVNDGTKDSKEDAKAVDLQHYVRAGIISMVLSTDNTKHDHLIADLGEVLSDFEKTQRPLEQTDGSVELRSPLSFPTGHKDDRQQKIPEVVLHAADISNPARPEPIMLYWTRRVLTEFWAQGDEEKRLGLEVSPLCDRTTGSTTVPGGQIGFATFVVRPLFMQLARLIPEVSEALDQLEKNGEFWKRKKEVNTTFEEIFPVIEDDEDKKDSKGVSEEVEEVEDEAKS